MNPINDEGTPEAYLRGKAMEHKLNLVSSMLSNLRLATGLNKEVFAYYQRGLQALEHFPNRLIR